MDLAAAAGIKKLGAGVGAGVFANLAELTAQVNRTNTPDCFLQAQEFFDINVGATASAGAGAGLKTFNVVPGVSTTLLMSPTETQCILKENPAAKLKPIASGSKMGNSTTSAMPMVTKTAGMMAREAATYVITTCASDIINCPPSLASIITVTESVAAKDAVVTDAPTVEALAVPTFQSLAAMPTPIVNSII